MATVKPTVKPDAPKTETASFEAPAPVSVDVPEAIRTVAEKSASQAKANYETARNSAEEATDVLEESYSYASKSANDLRLKAIETTRDNVNAAFEFAIALAGVKSLSEAIELQTSHARRQFEALTTQSKEFAQLAGQIASESAKPYQSLVSRGFSLGR
jgi:phasin